MRKWLVTLSALLHLTVAVVFLGVFFRALAGTEVSSVALYGVGVVVFLREFEHAWENR